MPDRAHIGPRKYAYNIDAAREREMHLYLPYWGYPPEKFAKKTVGHRPNVSPDNVLTALAQLTSLQLNAKRTLICLFDRTTQHVIAEATPKLGFRADQGDESDFLWLGDERFRSAPMVTGSPHHRFYVSVPIMSPESYVIGSIAVLDDRPREGLDDSQVRILRDISGTVMDHLLCQRATRDEHRDQKMVRGLGLFFTGKSDLNDGLTSPEHGDDPQDPLDEVDEKLKKVQITTDGTTEMMQTNYMDEDDTEISLQRGRTPKTPSTHSDIELDPRGAEQSRSRSPVHTFKADEKDVENNAEKREENRRRASLSPTTGELKKSLAPSNVQSVLNRASCLMKQALEVEGVMFIDASVYARRQMIGSTTGEGDNAEFNIFDENTSLNDNYFSDAFDDKHGPKSLVLGYSTSSTSSRDNYEQESHYISLPGGFVNHLIDHYPRGKIFLLDKDGSIALSHEGLVNNVNQAYLNGTKTIQAESPEEKHIRRETMEIQYFHKILPEARWISIYPVWDFHRSRWFTVNMAWTNDPSCTMSEPSDLTYMAAFSNSVMAEISRMDLQAADRAKSDFISSISHELRSPLHGVLGTVELLQEAVTTHTQRGLVETVASCGRTLLDTLNHLLDYAKINTIKAPQSSEEPSSKVSLQKAAIPGVIQDIDLSSLVQEVVEGLLAGSEFYNRETESSSKQHRRKSALSDKSWSQNRIITIVDIEWQDNWYHPIYSGAWRRIVMNLFGNALKYTPSGYIRLFIKEDMMAVQGSKELVPAVRLTISDSGRGMSQDFLRNHLYIPFLQEDTQSPGLGVGLHLVHQIIKSLAGRIQFRSEVDRGTEVDVIIPVQGSTKKPSLPSLYTALRERVSGKTVSFFTKSFDRGDLGIRQEVFNNIKSSLGRMATDWFGLHVLSADELQTQKADFLIVTEHEYRTLANESSQSDVRRSIESRNASPLIVLSGQASSLRVAKENSQDRAIFLSQPVCPKTLAAVLEHCLDLQEGQRDPDHRLGRALDGKLEIENTDLATEQEMIQTHTPEQIQLSEMSEEQHGSSENPSPSKKILLVEDNRINLKIMETSVKGSGFVYQTATNGREAVEKFKSNRFGVVVMDISMPYMDGLTATREMRHLEKTQGWPRTTIIILTAALSAQVQQDAAMSGVDEFLTKPIPLKQLNLMLRSLLRLNS
ncbi:hypothetical protein N7495_007552 [Penicillium taxi]|uniref:uncharacterized protein n=1 Tax=Penicillium taxi TaxID=168475 RepID=UPI00254581D3|nr:uncharacterized protein N7495_007552 [Penicillium taxi]KAJ5887511.1 hypothetical protein N7495_007552 [Penicillium taxi]